MMKTKEDNHMDKDPDLSTLNDMPLAEKRALLARLMREDRQHEPLRSPLSSGQKALWFLHQSAPDSSAYHVALSIRIRSPLQIEALRQACQDLVDRHEQLRVAFIQENGVPVQHIPAQRPVDFRQFDVAGISEPTLDACVQSEYDAPFDLSNDALFRVRLFTLAPDHHVLLLVVHHIVYDGWSLWMNFEELARLYERRTGESMPDLSALDVSYRNYIYEQQNYLNSPEGEQAWQFWRKELAGELPVVTFPADRMRPPVQTYRGASHKIALTRELTAALRTLAQREGVTPFRLLLACFQTLLHRYSGHDVVRIGSPAAGRKDARFANVVGYFVNPVVLQADFSDDPSFRTLLQQVAQQASRALAHQDFPFPVLVERLKPHRDPSCSPLFQVSFVFQKTQRANGMIDFVAASEESGSSFRWGGLDIEHFDLAQQEGQFDLELELLDSEHRMFGSFKYNTDLYDADTIARLTENFLVLLEAVVADPEQTVSRIPILSNAEAKQVLSFGGAHTAAQYPAICLQHSFEQAAVQHADRIAVCLGDQQLSYAELNRRANQLAHALREHGVGRNTLVGLFVERSIEMVVGLLAILKAGGAYVPLDPKLPSDRLAFIAEDSGIRMLLTQSALADQLPLPHAKQLLIDRPELWQANNAAENPSPINETGDLAYIIYTSGSTGKPKGSEITHANVARLFSATHSWFGFDHNDVWTLFHSFAFDFSVWEIWGALLYGGRLVIVPHEVSRSPAEFLRLLRYEQVTVLNQTPSAFQQLIQAEAQQSRDAQDELALRWVVFGGEALDVQALAPWFERHGDAKPRLVNMYGITETTVHVTFRPLSIDDVARRRSVIGVPIPDLRLYLLDRNLQPVPIGVAGEIHVAGAGLARGYLHRPDLTEARFIRHSMASGVKERLYKTGDLGRYLPNGDIEYLGRLDRQVKLRGFRIELGEIESALTAHPDIDQAVVLVHRRQDGNQQLVAYLVARTDAAPDTASLRRFLAASLPDYMVPALFITLDRFPLTGNGKLDQQALPDPNQYCAQRGNLRAPRDETERRLTLLWEKLLQRRPIGIDDNFFDLGGHSLLAVSLINNINRELGTSLAVTMLFRFPTVALLAEQIRAGTPGDAATAASALVPIQPEGTEPPFFCVAGGGGSVLYFYPLAQALPQQQPFYGFQAVGLDGRCEPLQRVEDMAAHYVEELLRLQPTGPYRLGGHCFGSWIAFEMAQQLLRRGESIELLTVIDAPAPHMVAQRPAPECDEADWLLQLAKILVEAGMADISVDVDTLRSMDPQERLSHFRDRMQAAGMLPEGEGIDQVRGLLNVFVANNKARYMPQDARPLPIVLLRASESHPDYDYSGADTPGVPVEQSTLGWEAFASSPVAVHMVPGNHITMMSDTCAPAMAAALAQHLEPEEAIEPTKAAA
jgi:amino acid adenylation domain-containing protein